MTHLDEARRDAADALVAFVHDDPTIEKAVLLDDVFGSVRAVVWLRQEGDTTQLRERLTAILAKAAGESFWSGQVWIHSSGTPKSDSLVYDRAWDEGRPIPSSDRVRITDQLRSRLAWFRAPQQPPWSVRDADSSAPRIVSFYSFKGGVGRTTALASFAVRRARAGDTVVVVDMDFDAPGAGILLAADEAGTTAPWGVVDYLLERRRGSVTLSDYYHTCARQEIAGNGTIRCFPAGRLDNDYLTKIARLDFEGSSDDLPVRDLLMQIRDELNPHWILLDVRAGLSPAAGILLSGLAHAYVLFASTSIQSWLGTRRVLHRLGAERLLNGQAQADCVLVQAMVPEVASASNLARADFAQQAEDAFVAEYYAEPLDDSEQADDEVWSVNDLDSSQAPHVPVPLPYTVRLAFFRDLGEVAEDLATLPDYKLLEDRICDRFPSAGGQWQD